MKTKIIRKSKIGWVVGEYTLVAFDRLQATLYHSYEAPNKQPLERMKQKVLESEPSEYNSWVDVVCLAREEGICGYGTRLKSEWFDES